MSRVEKLLASFLTCGEFAYSDFVRLVVSLGYRQLASGKTGGSRRRFAHSETKAVILLHEPHDGVLGKGTVEDIRSMLKDRGQI